MRPAWHTTVLGARLGRLTIGQLPQASDIDLHRAPVTSAIALREKLCNSCCAIASARLQQLTVYGRLGTG